MSNWLIAIGVALLIGGVATFHFHAIQMRRDETRAGIAALSGLSWRSFIHMVLDALASRGFTRLVDDSNAADDSDYVLQRDGQHWLLSCKHGSAFVLGRLTVNELARTIDLKGAAGGFLLTQGRITEDVRPFAAKQRIELLDGPTLWPQLRDLLPDAQRAAIRAKAAELARRRSLLSWLLALVAGIAVFLALPSRQASEAPAVVVAGEASAAGEAPQAVAPPAAVPALVPEAAAAAPEPAAQAEQATSGALPPDVATDTPATDAPATAPATPDAPAAAAPVAETPAPDAGSIPRDVGRQRAALAAALGALPDVDRAVWLSESTLEVRLARIDGDAFARICPLVERYDQISASRIQLTPPPDSAATVRFRQCRAY